MSYCYTKKILFKPNKKTYRLIKRYAHKAKLSPLHFSMIFVGFGAFLFGKFQRTSLGLFFKVVKLLILIEPASSNSLITAGLLLPGQQPGSPHLLPAPGSGDGQLGTLCLAS